MTLKLSVVIPSSGRKAGIETMLQTLAENDISPNEIIIVSQSQNRIILDVPEKIKKIVSLLYDNGTGISRAKNIGWRYASGDIIAFTDDDAWVHKEWVKNIIQTFQSDTLNAGIAGGKIKPLFFENNPLWKLSDKHWHTLPAYEQGETIGFFKNGALPPGVNYSIRKSLLIETGGFNEKLGVNSGKKIQIYGEDSDLSFRILKLGYNIIYNPNIIVYHPVPLSRQCDEFINKRLFTEGLTYVYLKKLQNNSAYIRINLFILAIIDFIKIMIFTTDKILLKEKKSIYKGKLYGLIHSMKFLDR